MARLASPTAAPLIAGGTALVTTTAAAVQNGVSMGLMAVVSTVGVAMLTDLVKSIPGQRQADKADESLRKLAQQMDDLHVQINQWSDQQYQFFTSMIENILSAGDADKLEFLRRAALNAALNGTVVEVGGAFLARVIRDITVPEIVYLMVNFAKQPLLLEPGLPEQDKEKMSAFATGNAMVIVETENDEEVVTGLQVLGLLRNGSSRNGGQDLVWTRTAGKILTLLRPPSAATPA